jgi:hypothetical protein
VVELDVDSSAVIEGHFDLVVALLVFHLSVGDATLTDVVQRDLNGTIEVRSGNRLLGAIVVRVARLGGGVRIGDPTGAGHLPGMWA